MENLVKGKAGYRLENRVGEIDEQKMAKIFI